MIDHLVYAVPDLAAAMDELERDWGVRPAPGGKHEGRGSHNALLSLGDGPYLELIARDPEQVNVDIANHPFQLAGLVRPTLRTWAAKAPGIAERVARARSAGYDPGTPLAMSRALPGGAGVLHWHLTRSDGANQVGDGVVPFLIDWGGTPHPATTSPAGAKLVSLRLEHPNPGPVRDALRALEETVEVTQGPVPALFAVIDTPNGRRELR